MFPCSINHSFRLHLPPRAILQPFCLQLCHLSQENQMNPLQHLHNWRRQHPSLLPKQQQHLYHCAIELFRYGRLIPLPLPPLYDVPEDLWPFVVQPIQCLTELLEKFYSLTAIQSVLPCEAKGHLRALVCNNHMPSSPPHLSVLVTLLYPPVFNEPPLWHVHFAQVTAGQQLQPLLNHQKLGPTVMVHEVFPESSCTMRY